MSGEVGNPVGRSVDPATEGIAARANAPPGDPGSRNEGIAATLERSRAKPDASVLDILSRPIKSRLTPHSFSPGAPPPPQDSAPLPKVTPKAALGLNVFGADAFKVVDLDSSSTSLGDDPEILFDAGAGQAPQVQEPEVRAPATSLAQILAETVDRSVTVDVASRHKARKGETAPTISSPRIINGMPGSVALLDNRIRYDPGDGYDDLAVGEILAAEIGYRISGGDPAEEHILRIFVAMTEDGPEAHVAPVHKVVGEHRQEDLSLEEWVAAASGQAEGSAPDAALAEPVGEAHEGLADLEGLLVQAWQEEWDAPDALQDGEAADPPDAPQSDVPDLAAEEAPAVSGIRAAFREMVRRAEEKSANAEPEQEPGDNNDLTEPFGWLLDQQQGPEEDGEPNGAADGDDDAATRHAPSVGKPERVEHRPEKTVDLSRAGRESEHLAERMRAIMGETEADS